MAAPWQLRNAKRWNRPRPLFEELPSIDARWLARHDMVPRDWGRRVYDFSFINPAFGGLIITPRVCEVVFRDGRQQIVSIHWQHIQGACLGTTRPLFLCPCCKVRRFKLYDLHGEFYCKRCAAARGVIYACQLGDGSRRRALQATRLLHFLNGWAGQSPSKTPLMHKQTYRRLTSRLRQLEAKGITNHQAKAVHSLGHRIVKPTQMYRTQTASIASA